MTYARLCMLFPFRLILSLSQKLKVSQSLILSLFDYADTIYTPCLSQKILNCIQRVKNSCLRFSYNVRKFDHISPFFLVLAGCKSFKDMFFHLCCLVHNILIVDIPYYLLYFVQMRIFIHEDSSFTFSLFYPKS